MLGLVIWNRVNEVGSGDKTDLFFRDEVVLPFGAANGTVLNAGRVEESVEPMMPPGGGF